MKISSQDFQYLLAFVVISTIVASGVAYRTLSPPPTEQFFAMWILGSNGLAEHYYPRNNPNITMDENVNWTLGVYNHMGSLQYVVVQVKLLNSTLASPDELPAQPSPSPPLYEFTRVIIDNETWSVPFVWRILNVTSTGENLRLTGLVINQFATGGALGTAVSGFNYRFVFELWFYDRASNNLAFSWRTQNFQRTVWTQIWFNVTAPTAR